VSGKWVVLWNHFPRGSMASSVRCNRLKEFSPGWSKTFLQVFWGCRILVCGASFACKLGRSTPSLKFEKILFQLLELVASRCPYYAPERDCTTAGSYLYLTLLLRRGLPVLNDICEHNHYCMTLESEQKS